MSSVWSILAIALALRTVFACYYVHGRAEHALGVIPFLSEPGNIAHSLVIGQGFSSPFLVNTGATAWMAPVYPAILGGIFRVLGIYTYHSFLAAVGLNIVCASLVCVPIFRIGTRIGGLAVGAGAAWLWAIFPNAILIPVESMWDACLSALLLSLILWATLSLAESRSTRAWLGYGFLWGFALITNPSLGSVLPIFLGWAGFRSGRSAEVKSKSSNWAWIKRPALSLAVAVLCCVPWTIRNYAVFRALVPVRSGMGLSLWLGNNADAEQRPVGFLHPISSSIERERYIELGEIGYMRMKKDEAVGYMVSHPGRVLSLAATRFVSFWSGGTAHPVDDFLQRKYFWFRYVLLFNVLAGVGCLAGIVALVRRRDIYALPVASLPIVFPCVYYLTVVTPRYRLPVDPVVLLLTAIAFSSSVRQPSSAPTLGSMTSKGVEACV
jgi:4-amino-4-deoxy-L-arabinose transferase-like glycosyltransferase